MVDDATAEWLADYRFTGDIDGYAEGELFFPGSPILTVSGTFAECVVLETLVAVGAQPRQRDRRGGGPDGHRRARPAADRDGLAADPRGGRGRRRPGRLPGRLRVHLQPGGRPRATASRPPAPPRTRSRCCTTTSRPRSPRRSPRWARTPRCWSTRTTSARASATRSRWPGPDLRAIRIDSGDLSVLAQQSRELLDSLGATETKIIVSGDLDEYAIAALAAEPVDVYGAGTAVVTGSGAPDRRPGLQAGRGRGPAGGEALREQGHRRRPQDRGPPAQADRHRHRGDHRARRACPTAQPNDRLLQRPYVRRRRAGATLPTLAESREHLRRVPDLDPVGGAEALGRRPGHPGHRRPAA